MGQVTERIRAYDREISTLATTRYPATRLLTQVQGVGDLTALAYLLTIDNPHRFRKSRTVGAYLGLRSRRTDSGEQKPELPITKAGDALVRRLLVGSAQYTLGPFAHDSDLRRWGLGKAQGGKAARRRAVVGVARRLGVLLHRLWVTGEVYEPLRNSPAKESA